MHSRVTEDALTLFPVPSRQCHVRSRDPAALTDFGEAATGRCSFHIIDLSIADRFVEILTPGTVFPSTKTDLQSAPAIL